MNELQAQAVFWGSVAGSAVLYYARLGARKVWKYVREAFEEF